MYGTSAINDQFVHAPRPQGCTDSVHDSLAGIDVADELGFALGRVCPLLQ